MICLFTVVAAACACSDPADGTDTDTDHVSDDLGPDGDRDAEIDSADAVDPARCPSASASAPEISVALQGGTQDYTVFRIPSVVVTSDSTLVVFAEGRPSIMDPGVGGIDLVATRSTDCGATWSPLAVLAAGGVRDAHNPTSVVVDVDGAEEIWLFYNIHPATGEDEFDLPAGLDESSARVFWIRSTDRGERWTAPVELTADIKDPTWRLVSMGPGAAIQTHWGTDDVAPGRVLVPGWWTTEDGGGCFVFWTDNLGDTWERGALPPTVCSESQVLELTDGRIVLDTRQAQDAVDSPDRQWMESSDGGASWSDPRAGLPMTPIMSGLARYTAQRDGDAEDLVLHTGVASDDRADLRFWRSVDEGATWQDETVLVPGFVQYSQPVVLPDGSVGVVFEGIGTNPGPDGVPGTGLNIQFARFDLALVDW